MCNCMVLDVTAIYFGITAFLKQLLGMRQKKNWNVLILIALDRAFQMEQNHNDTTISYIG